MRDDDVVLAACARTPFGRFGGALRGLDAPALGALAIDEVLRRAAADAAAVDVVYGGVGMISAAMLTPVRQAVLRSRLPETTPSAAIDRACCSGMTAIGLGFKDIRLGEAYMALAGGFESLSRTPMLWPRQREARIGPVTVDDPLLLRGAVVEQPIAVYSGQEALRHGVTREQQDRWAQQSHQRYADAQAARFFDGERFAVAPPGGPPLLEDELPRAEVSLEKLAALPTVYGGPTITAGNAPGLNDGAAFVLLARRDAARAAGLAPLARIVDYVQVCGGPTSGTTTPALAIQRLAERQRADPLGWDLLEINEAYAATPLVSTLLLARHDPARLRQLRERTNVHGGAVALGHPLGASGARLVMTLALALRRRGGGRGAAAICGGFGQGDAVLVEAE